MKIKIMHVVQAAGGVDRYLNSLLKYLDYDKYENILVCSKDYKKEAYVGITDSIEYVDMSREISLNDLKAVFKVRKLIKKYKPDIVYAHSSKAGAILRIADIGIKNICLYNAHGWSFNMQCTSEKQKIYKIMEKIMAPFCDAIVCISDAEKESAESNRICKKDKLSVIYNGIDIREYDSEQRRKVSRKELNIPNDAFVIGTVGRLSKQKAPDIFIMAANTIKSKISNAYFIMVGDGEQRIEIENMAKKLGLNDSLLITGWVDNPMSYMELFDVAMLLSRWEGFGLVIPEYMLCKKPVIATNVDAIPNIITDGINGLLVPLDNPQKASEAVERLYNDNELLNRLVQQGESDVREKYNVRRVAREHERLFEQLIYKSKR